MKLKQIAVILTLIIVPTFVFSENTQKKGKPENAVIDSVQLKVNFLRRYFIEDKSWRLANSEFGRNIKSLINFLEDEPIDSVINILNISNSDTITDQIVRLPEDVADTLEIPGFVSTYDFNEKILDVENSVLEEFRNKEMVVPVDLISGIENKVKLISQEEVIKLYADSVLIMPDSLKLPEELKDTLVKTAGDVKQILRLDSIRDALIEEYRVTYNDSVVKSYRDSVLFDYRKKRIEEQIDSRVKEFTDSVMLNNFNVVREYNDSINRMVNDSVKFVLNDLIQYAVNIDSTRLIINNLNNETKSFILKNNERKFARVWLKNKQNDSLSVLLENIDKNSLRILIDDGITFSRFNQRESKEIDFNTFKPAVDLDNVKKKYQLETPWSIGGDGTVGFTQTYLSNWKKGGKSAVSMLMVLKGFANYSTFDEKIKWENSVEILNGWIKPGGTDDNGDNYESQKNDDKFEFISRVGISAFKKWYYGAEIDFETQFFNGYNYPTSQNPDPISALLAPAKTLFKVGMDYKPSKNLSVFISPLTSKTVSIRDTITINKSNYGIQPGSKRLWIPGLNADIKYKTEITPDISYETKYKMFFNYRDPFRKFDINWENLLVMRLTDHINMRMMVHLLYDDDVKFKVIDENGNESQKAKLQIKELINIGFSYKINKKVYRSRKINL